MSVAITIKVKEEVLRLAEKMVEYGLARSRSHAINLMIEKGLDKIVEEVRLWERMRVSVEELKKENYRIRHGGLSEILNEGRTKR
ncbi:MAG: hypothetical protein DRN04_14210 [Thermoprotei archaeon]|nr:MAG: hypothetical protein DRN04_14210 [Thermoprotei archaeon]